MRSLARSFERIVQRRNLWRAWLSFQKDKRRRSSVRAFEAVAVHQVAALGRELVAGSYRPQGYRLLLIEEPKRRLIAGAPVRDRVVHHAVHQVLAPFFNRSLIDTTFACLPERGTHRARLAFLSALRRFRFVLSLDIRHYFLSIDRRVLLQLLASRLKDQRTVDLLATIADSGDGLYQSRAAAEHLCLPEGFPPLGCGVPIGNLTSQWWGNLYLSGFDHYAKRDLKVPHYQRYMDDLTFFANSRAELLAARDAAREWLGSERRLRLKDPDAPVRSTSGRVLYLGYEVTRAGIVPSPDLMRRFRQRVGDVLLTGDRERLARTLASYRGVLGISQ